MCINQYISHCLNEYASCLTAAVEKVAVLCRFLDIHSVTKNHLLKYSLAHAFCCFLTAVEDVNPAVATRAGLLLDTIKRPALQVGALHGKNTFQWETGFSLGVQMYNITVDANTTLGKHYWSWCFT